MSRPVRLLLGIVAILLVLVLAVAAFCWWKIAGLKETLVQDLGKALGAQVEVSSIDFDLWKGELRAAGISLINNRAGAPWQKGAINQATVRFHLQDLPASTLPVTVEISSWNVTLDPRSATATPEPEPAADVQDPKAKPGGRRVQVTEISAHDGSVEIQLHDNRTVELQGVAFESSDNGGGWTTQLQAASIAAGTLQAGASSVEIRSEPDKLTIFNLRMACDTGAVTGDGEVSLKDTHSVHFALKATDLPMTMLVAVQWQMKLSGLVSGDITYQGDDQGDSAAGKLMVNHGKFNVLPFLSKVTDLIGVIDISNVEVDQATSDFLWKDHAFHFTNIDIRKNDAARFSGSVDIDPNGQVNGQLKLGLPAALLEKWPQLQEKVFTLQLEDYDWADVHLTGTPDHLQEDLTPRLVAVGIDQGSGLINSAVQKASDLLKSFMGK